MITGVVATLQVITRLQHRYQVRSYSKFSATGFCVVVFFNCNHFFCVCENNQCLNACRPAWVGFLEQREFLNRALSAIRFLLVWGFWNWCSCGLGYSHLGFFFFKFKLSLLLNFVQFLVRILLGLRNDWKDLIVSEFKEFWQIAFAALVVAATLFSRLTLKGDVRVHVCLMQSWCRPSFFWHCKHNSDYKISVSMMYCWFFCET